MPSSRRVFGKAAAPVTSVDIHIAFSSGNRQDTSTSSSIARAGNDHDVSDLAAAVVSSCGSTARIWDVDLQRCRLQAPRGLLACAPGALRRYAELPSAEKRSGGSAAAASIEWLPFDALLWVTGSEPPALPKARAISVNIPGILSAAPAGKEAAVSGSRAPFPPVAFVDPALPMASSTSGLLADYARAAARAAADAPLPWFVVGAGPEALETAALLSIGARAVRRAAADKLSVAESGQAGISGSSVAAPAAEAAADGPASSSAAIRVPKVVLLCNEASPLASMLPPFMAQWLAARIARARLPVQPYTGVQFLQLHKAVPPRAKPASTGAGDSDSAAEHAAPSAAEHGQPGLQGQGQQDLQVQLPPHAGRVVLYTVATYDALKTGVQPADAVLFAPPAGAWVPSDTRLAEGVGAAATETIHVGASAASAATTPAAVAAASAAALSVLSSPQRVNAIELDSGWGSGRHGHLRDGQGHSAAHGGSAVAANAELQSCSGVFVAGDGMRYADVGSGQRVRHARDADAAVASAELAAHNLLCSLGINRSQASDASASAGSGAGAGDDAGRGPGMRLFTHTPVRDYGGALAAVLGVRLTTIGNVDAALETHAFFTAAAPPALGGEDAAAATADAEAASTDDASIAGSSDSSMAADFARSRPSPHLRRLAGAATSANANVTAAGAGVSAARCFGIVFYTSGSRVEGALLWSSTGAGSFGLARAAARTDVQLSPTPDDRVGVVPPVSAQASATQYSLSVLQRLLMAGSAPTTEGRFQLPVNRDEQAALLRPIAAALLTSQLTHDENGAGAPRSAISGSIQHVWSTGRTVSVSQRPHPLGFV